MASCSIRAAVPLMAALLLLALACAPSPAYASPDAEACVGLPSAPVRSADGAEGASFAGLAASAAAGAVSPALEAAASGAEDVEFAKLEAADRALEQRDKRLTYDPALIEAVGNQTDDGHWGCCPGYSCAYGDAIITGRAIDHSAYSCRCCTWPGWGGGDSSFRSLGSNQALLREAYDEIAAGRPTVVHVAGPSGEHWICLMGYRGVEDADALSLDSFLAIDPVSGAEIAASDGYALYGDFCEHVSDLR